VEFQSAVEAVICGSEFQNTIKERNSSVPEEEQMEFRIGINIGDVVIEGDNLYGEGVNVAARLEALAQPGGVCLSKNVHEIVNKKTNFQFHDLGEQTVKNTVLHAVDVTLDGTSQRKLPKPTTEKQSSTEKPPAIAVLPFANMSGDSEQEYFADGITEDIITNLSLWKTFPVISRNSSFTFKGKSVKIKEAAEELGVRYIVEGSVRKGGNKVRITAQLIDAYEDQHLWSKKWDRDLDDIFEVQDEVSTAIAALVSPAVKGKEQVRVFRKQTSNMSAWDEYLRGLSCYNNHEPSDIVKKYCYKSIELDDSLSDSYILICNSLYQEIYGSYGPDRGLERKNKEEEFHKNALKSFQLDSENPEALIALSRSYNLKKDFENRIEYMKLALNINPNHADANYEYGLSLTTYKEFEKAKQYALIGLQLNPKQQRYFPIILCCVGLNEFEEALKYCNKSIEVDPKFTGAFGWKSSMLGHLDRLDEAKEILSDYLKLRPEIKNINDYEKVAPTVIKEILMEGLIKAGMPNE
jgi:adenylate cyclase